MEFFEQEYHSKTAANVSYPCFLRLMEKIEPNQFREENSKNIYFLN